MASRVSSLPRLRYSEIINTQCVLKEAFNNPRKLNINEKSPSGLGNLNTEVCQKLFIVKCGFRNLVL